MNETTPSSSSSMRYAAWMKIEWGRKIKRHFKRSMVFIIILFIKDR